MTALTVDEMRAAFPPAPTTLYMSGPPTARGLSAAVDFIIQCSRKVASKIDPHNNYLFIAIGPRDYAHYARPGSTFPTDSYPRPAQPPDFPVFAGAATSGEQARIKAEFEFQSNRYTAVSNMHTALIETMLSFIHANYQEAYVAWEAHHLDRSFVDAMQWFLDTYAQDTQAEERLAAENEVINFPWDPKDGMEPLLKKISTVSNFFIHINNPKTDAQKKDYILLHMKKSGLYITELKKWNLRNGSAGQETTYDACVTFFRTETLNANKVQPTPAAGFGHGLMNAAVTDDTPTVQTFDNFAAATASNAAAHADAQRTITSQQMQIQELQQQIQQPFQPQQNAFVAQQQAAAQQAAAQQQTAFVAQQQAAAQQAMMNQQMNFMQHQQPFPSMPYAPTQQSTHPGRQQPHVWTSIPMPRGPPQNVRIDPNGKGSDGRNYRVWHQNLNYCPTCGCATDDNHLPAQCPKVPRHPNHNNNATRANPMGGTYKGAHKFIYIPNGGPAPQAGGRGGRGQRRNRYGGRGGRGRGRGRGGYQQQQQQYGTNQFGQQQQYGTNQFGQMNAVAATDASAMNQQWNGNNQQWSYASPSM